MNVTGLQRLAAAANGEVCDRIPVLCNLLDQGARELGISLREYYSRGECVAEGQLRMRERYGYDAVWSLFYVGKEAELLGCTKILFAEDGPPNVQEYVVRGPDDIRRLHVPDDVAAHPAFEESLKCLAILRREVGGGWPVCAYVTASMALPALLMGMDKWMELLLLGPAPERDDLLEKCHVFFAREVKAYRDAGADILLYSNPFGSTDTVPQKLFMEQSLPWIERDIGAIGPEGVVYYCGMSRMNSVLDVVRERTGIGVYYLSPLDSVREAKSILNGRAMAWGVVNDIRLIDWSREEIRQAVREIIEAGMPGGRFGFGTGVMPWGIPAANIAALLEAAYEFGRWREE